MKNPKLSIGINTEPFSLKLRAISKHSTALADDLDKIDSATCNDCGGLMEVTELYADGYIADTLYKCLDCDEESETK